MKLIDLDALLKYPIRLKHYDRKNGDKNFVLGIESVMKYAESLPIKIETASETNLCPCDLCVYNPPSSLDGKPCCMCPAEAKYEPKEETK